MPTLGAYQRIVIKGTGPGSEIWQTGFSTYNPTAITSQPGLQAYLNSIVPLVATWWTAVKANCYAIYAWTDVIAYQYQSPSTAAQFQAEAVQTPVVGTQAGVGSPIDTACVVSLRTAVPGRRTRGRMYVPCHAPVQPTTGEWQNTTSQGIGTATKTLLSGVFTSTTGGVVVVSRTGLSYETVTGVVTDNKPDVQRRRENRLAPGNIQVLTVP